MNDYPFAFPVVAVGPASSKDDDDYYGNDVVWFRADDATMQSDVAFNSSFHGFSSWLLFDDHGMCWLIRGLTVVRPKPTGWKSWFRSSKDSKKTKGSCRLRVDRLWDAGLEEARRRVCDAYANERNLVWECLAIDRKLDCPEEARAAIDGEVQRLAEAKDMSELIDRLQDLSDRRAAEAH
jgi:hypothetical protein